MKKLGIVLGVAAVATITGCKDPDYVGRGSRDPQNEAKSVETTPKAEPTKTEEKSEPEKKPAKVEEQTEVVEEASCLCPPGTKHTQPCGCGATDCKCIVEKPQPTPPPAEPEYTVYIVQSGDYLAKISKRYNVTIASIRELNPSVKNSDLIRVGQKLKLPGKIDVSAQPAPAKTEKSATTSKVSTFKPYTGATKEYVVKSGDTLGGIAYGNGINIRQLKELNGLSSDVVRVGQKLKIPANGKPAVKPQTSKTGAKDAGAKTGKQPVVTTPATPAETNQPPVVDDVQTGATVAPVESDVATPAPEVEKPAATATTTYVVQEGDDMTGISIAFGTSAAVIRELNNLGENEQLKPGQVIKLPADGQL